MRRVDDLYKNVFVTRAAVIKPDKSVARTEYDARAEHVSANTRRLKDLRLEREAADRAIVLVTPPPRAPRR